MAKSDGCDYFKRTSLFWIVSVTLGVGYFTVSSWFIVIAVKSERLKKGPTLAMNASVLCCVNNPPGPELLKLKAYR